MLKPVKSTANGLKNHEFVQVEKYRDIPDTEIIDRVLNGETHLFEILMRRYNQRLYRIQRSYIRDEEAVKDVLQLTYLKAYEKLAQFRGDSKFSTWITRIAIHEALKHLKERRRYTNLHALNEKSIDEAIVNHKKNPEDRAIENEFKNMLEASVNQLPAKYRTVYIMREVEQISTRDTAECLDISESNVKVRLHRAKQMIKDDLERKVAETEIFDFLGRQCDLMVYRVMRSIRKHVQ